LWGRNVESRRKSCAFPGGAATFTASFDEPPSELILNSDTTDDRVHGHSAMARNKVLEAMGEPFTAIVKETLEEIGIKERTFQELTPEHAVLRVGDRGRFAPSTQSRPAIPPLTLAQVASA
jgi:hypothetical protein